jgi:hypothetical protein
LSWGPAGVDQICPGSGGDLIGKPEIFNQVIEEFEEEKETSVIELEVNVEPLTM